MNHKTPIQFQNSLYEITYVNTRNINITITRPVSIRVVRHCDDTVDKKWLNSCVLKHLLCWREFSNYQNGQKNLEMFSPKRSSFPNFAEDITKKEVHPARFFENALHAGLNWLINQLPN